MKLRHHLRLYIIAFLILGAFSLLLYRLWVVQVLQNEKWSSRMLGRGEINVRVPGVRGEIKDRNGVVLATNEANYEVVFYLDALKKHYESIGKALPRMNKVAGKPDSGNEIDIVKAVNESIIKPLAKVGLDQPYSHTHLRSHYRTHLGLVPFVYIRDLGFEEFSRYAEHSFDIPGLEVRAKPSRIYPYRALAAHTLGYMGLFDDQKIDKEELRSFNHYVGDDIGIAGIEKSMNGYLQAVAGKRILEKDEKGAIVREKKFIPPQNGADIILSIDARIQYIAELAMRSVGKGAAVVIDPNNGDILALVSVPSYDPNVFIPNISLEEWKQIDGDITKPLINRALRSYNPGSTFKIPTAIAGLLKDKNFAYHTEYCSGYTPIRNPPLRCWISKYNSRHGRLNLVEAIKRSCNCYFYQSSQLIGIYTMKKAFSLLGLGQQSGIPLAGESPGRVADPDWLQLYKPNLRWSKVNTANLSIGQGYAEATPLQLAMMVSVIANGGYYHKPRLIKKIDVKGAKREVKVLPNSRLNLIEQGVSAGGIEKIRIGMKKVVNEKGGTAGRASLIEEGIILSGKTGTAQTGRKRSDGQNDTNAFFVCFAPYEKPRLAIAVYARGGESGGKVAAPIAKAIALRSLRMIEDKERIIPLAIKAAEGHNQPIAEITFDQLNDELLPEPIHLVTALDTDAEETGGSDSLLIKDKENEYKTPKPSIKKSVVKKKKSKRTYRAKTYKKRAPSKPKKVYRARRGAAAQPKVEVKKKKKRFLFFFPRRN